MQVNAFKPWKLTFVFEVVEEAGLRKQKSHHDYDGF